MIGYRAPPIKKDGRAHDVGYFSLPGAQPKLALLYEDGRWGIPSGRIPTTHNELASISARDWDRVGATGGIESPRERVRRMVEQLPERVEATFKEFKSRGLAAKVISVLRTQILQQVKTALAVSTELRNGT